MDPLFLTIATVAAGVFALVALRGQNKRAQESNRIIEEAKIRAQERERTRRAESGTEHSDHRYFVPVEGIEVHDRNDGRDYLDDDQKLIIARIMDGFPPELKADKVHKAGKTPFAAAGAPFAGSLFDNNRVEEIDPWKNAVR